MSSRQSSKAERTCIRCGTKFMAANSELKRGGGKYCNLKCFRTSTKTTHSCQQCGNTFTKHKAYSRRGDAIKFCGRECMNASHGTFEERFLSFVSKSDECWLWTGDKDKDGYGEIRKTEGKKYRVTIYLFHQNLC